MPSGGARRGAGRKPKSLDELRLSGSFRPGRHAHLLRSVPRPALVTSKPVPAAVPAASALGAAGRAFVDAVLIEYEGWTVAERELLRLAGRALDDEQAAPDAVGRQRAARTFAGLVAQLGLGRGK
jgi:hypothetical protein